MFAYEYIHKHSNKTVSVPSLVNTRGGSLNSLLFLFFLLNSLLTVLLIAPVLSRSLCIVSILRGRSLPLAVVAGKLQMILEF